MSSAGFVNRAAELRLLEELHASGRAELFVLYGRRRVGKTELLRAFCRGRRHLFFVADQTPDREQLAAFSRRLWALGQGEPEEDFTFPSWEAAFRFLAGLARDERLVVVLDEFPYLVEANRALPSILQKVWEEVLQASRVMLVLCGSFVGFMEREVLAHRSPLYGRRTGQYLLEPLGVADAAAFFPGRDAVWQIETCAVLGGVPAYLSQFRGVDDLMDGIASRILRKGTFLYDEPRFLVMQELREPANYFSLLRAVAGGKTRLNEIARASALPDRGAASRYLDTLRELGILEHAVPVTEDVPHKSRKGVYRLRDPFFRFWFRFVHPYRSELEEGEAEAMLRQRVAPRFPEFVGPVFEEVARQHVRALGRRDGLPFRPARVGAWWDAGEEIDVVAVDEEGTALLAGECKWWQGPVGEDLLGELKQRVAVLLGRTAGRWRQPPRVFYALFSRAGFTPELRAAAAREGVLLGDVATLLTGDPAGDG